MDIPAIILIAISLSMGAYEISLSTGKTLSRIKFGQAVKVAFFLIALHIPVLLAGWYSGEKLDILIKQYEHWIALGILTLLGLKMILESFMKRKSSKSDFNSVTITLLLGMLLAALFDALIIGISFALLNFDILPILLITGITFFFISVLGIFRGKYLKRAIYYNIKSIGGVLLILAGVVSVITTLLIQG